MGPEKRSRALLASNPTRDIRTWAEASPLRPRWLRPSRPFCSWAKRRHSLATKQRHAFAQSCLKKRLSLFPHPYSSGVLVAGPFAPAPRRPLARNRRAAELAQEVLRAAFQAADLLACHVAGVRAESTRLAPQVQRDLLETMIEDAHGPPVPPRPHRAAEILRRHRVERLRDFDVSVAAHLALGLVEQREAFARQRQQRGPLQFREHTAHLPPRAAVNPRVGHRRFPLGALPFT